MPNICWSSIIKYFLAPNENLNKLCESNNNNYSKTTPWTYSASFWLFPIKVDRLCLYEIPDIELQIHLWSEHELSKNVPMTLLIGNQVF